MVVHDAIDTHGSSSLDIRQLGWSNAMLQSSSSSALDQVLIQDAQHHQWQPQGLTKIGELGYDFFRQRITIEIQDEKGDRFIITKGAAHKLLDLCTHERTQTHSTAEISTVRRAQINQLCQEQGQQDEYWHWQPEKNSKVLHSLWMMNITSYLRAFSRSMTLQNRMPFTPSGS
jgi:Mg2+-importing ATPase